MFNYESCEVSRDDFYVALINFCEGWVKDFAVPIVKRADELYDNTAIRWLVMRYNEIDEKCDRQRKNYLRDVLEGVANPIKPSEYLANERHELYSILHDMLMVYK